MKYYCPRGTFFYTPEALCFHSMVSELKSMQGKRIQILTAVRPPAGRPPNITGIVQKVEGGLLFLNLSSEKENTEQRIGVYSICDIVGFVPATKEDSQCQDKGENTKEENEMAICENGLEVNVSIKRGYVTANGRVAVSMELPEGAAQAIDLTNIYIADPNDCTTSILEPLEASVETEENVLVAIFDAGDLLDASFIDTTDNKRKILLIAGLDCELLPEDATCFGDYVYGLAVFKKTVVGRPGGMPECPGRGRRTPSSGQGGNGGQGGHGGQG